MLTPKQERAILALLSAPDQKSAAEQAGVTEQSVSRWMQSAEFRKALDAARGEFRRASIAELARRQAEQLQPV